jgi:hypothetical protein
MQEPSLHEERIPMSHQPHQPDTPALDPATEARLVALFQRLTEERKRQHREEAARKLAGAAIRVKHSA